MYYYESWFSVWKRAPASSPKMNEILKSDNTHYLWIAIYIHSTDFTRWMILRPLSANKLQAFRPLLQLSSTTLVGIHVMSWFDRILRWWRRCGGGAKGSEIRYRLRWHCTKLSVHRLSWETPKSSAYDGLQVSRNTESALALFSIFKTGGIVILRMPLCLVCNTMTVEKKLVLYEDGTVKISFG